MRRLMKVVTAGILCGLMLVGPGSGASAAPGGAARVNVNTASAEELARIPGIGPAKARAIIAHRSERPFTRPEELRAVKGIGDKIYEQVKDRITVGTPGGAAKGRGS